MAKYAVSAGAEWVADVVAETEEEALEKGRQIRPDVDSAEQIAIIGARED